MTKSKTANKKEDVKVTEVVVPQTPKLKEEEAKVDKVLSSEETVNLNGLIAEKDAEIKSLKQKISDLTHFENENVSFKGELAAKDAEIEDLKVKLSDGQPENPKEVQIAVHHGVVIGSKTYSKKDIEENEEIQAYLLASKSTAVTKVD